MSKKAFKAIRARLRGEQPKMNPVKHPVLSGHVRLETYHAPRWAYGNRKG